MNEKKECRTAECFPGEAQNYRHAALEPSFTPHILHYMSKQTPVLILSHGEVTLREAKLQTHCCCWRLQHKLCCCCRCSNSNAAFLCRYLCRCNLRTHTHTHTAFNPCCCCTFIQTVTRGECTNITTAENTTCYTITTVLLNHSLTQALQDCVCSVFSVSRLDVVIRITKCFFHTFIFLPFRA